MAHGAYGIKRSADVAPVDTEIFYSFASSRTDLTTNNWQRLDPVDILLNTTHPDDPNRLLEGAYNLRLSNAIFNAEGVYSILIRPRRILTRIIDCGVLADRSDIKGIIFDISTIDPADQKYFTNDGLVGFRVEYLDDQSNSSQRKIRNFYRVITSSNLVEPIAENLTNTSQKGLRYRLNDASTLLFCTVTPSSPSSVKPNAALNIGQPNQEVLVNNTFFNPVMIELTLTEHDTETIAYALYGNQTKSCADGIRTIYNFDDEIFRQFTERTDNDFEIRTENEQIDFTKDLDNIVGQ